MGNYTDLEYEFVERTLALVEQYEGIKHSYSFEQQYNHTLLINCLTGLIVLPKERTISSIPKDRLCTSPLKDWTKFKKQFRTIKLGNYEKRKKVLQS